VILITIFEGLLINHACASNSKVLLKEALPISWQHALKNVNECKLFRLSLLGSNNSFVCFGLLLTASGCFLLLAGELEHFLFGSVLLGVEVEGELELKTVAVGVDPAN